MKEVVDLVQRQLEDSPELVAAFVDFLERSEPENPSLLIEEVDQSDYSTRDWVEALLAFDRWLASQGTALRPFAKMMGYVHCCALITPPGLGLPSLESVVNQSLDEFGFAYLDELQN